MAAAIRPSARRLNPGGGPALVFVPALAPGLGIGHFRRCLELAGDGRGLLCLPRRLYEENANLRDLTAGVKIIFSLAEAPPGACAVFDSRETDRARWREAAGRMLVAGIDEGGRERGQFHALVDTLLMQRGRVRPNAFLLPVPPGKGRRPPASFKNILVSFGGEDRAGLSELLLRSLLEDEGLAPESIAVVEGPLFGKRRWPKGVKVVRRCRNLALILDDYDLLFTHYGLGAYEGLSRGRPVVLFNPSRYHRDLSRRDGFPEIGVGKVDRRRLHRLLSDPAAFEREFAVFAAKAASRETLPAFFQSFSPRGAAACPVCGRSGGRVLERFPLKTYVRCRGCGMIRLVFWGAPKKYDAGYFFSEYRAQYGKTYLEDFTPIKQQGARRVGMIEKRLVPSAAPPRLLDVGAAYGPFLDAARDRGWDAAGLELSPAAARHVREKLRIPCQEGDFLQVRFEPNSFDIITMWYVLEHFVPTGEVLAKANRLLRTGGVFALAAPSGSGVSFRARRRSFLEKSPDDHFTLWSPRTVKKALARFGFRLEKIVVTGHHPERFGKWAGGKIRSRLALILSRLFGLGDTFEAYARKVKDCR